MIDEVGTDTWEIMDNWDFHFLEMIGGSDPGEHQNLKF